MPHLIIQYSSNLEHQIDFTALCKTVNEAIVDTGLFETGAVRVRASSAHHFAIADGAPENGFVDMNFRIGTGRSEEEKKRAGEMIFAAAEKLLPRFFETPHFALSLEIREIDPVFSWRRNTLHARFRDQA
ncbi:5-carboxymethyl-2-hydroxymuconate Delta-isomerase [Rhizobium sp. Root1204]|uniref:5-carboxymethyl-2-hydroxymuconate Delta-isomerase n=1 Tax=Rhizobium sp. Root1204 TaxID=1736428 RepID=UPI0007124744|nr:5-carboxymethyl-2-hydroxymuconate Delta-isomerase [Rhizobium sp. Root1204]KQV41357.1 5-carboxymethyl-2-hydroxymuconate isomerase [Rhizobium sp. Root1204]